MLYEWERDAIRIATMGLLSLMAGVLLFGAETENDPLAAAGFALWAAWWMILRPIIAGVEWWSKRRRKGARQEAA